MKCCRVCFIVLIATLSIFGLFFSYLNHCILNNLSVEHSPRPSLTSRQKELYTKVFKEFVNEVPRLNDTYIKEIYESASGDIIVCVEYFDESFSLIYVNGKIIKAYHIRDRLLLPYYYVFDADGRLLRKGIEKGLPEKKGDALN